MVDTKIVSFEDRFFEQEDRGGFIVLPEMKKLWAIEIQLAQKLIEVCEENNLNVYADGGTLLGAIRHKGYIPWDDDMDFVMFRKDYDKLVEIAEKEFKAPFFFQTVKTDDKSFSLHTRLRMDGTTAIQKRYQSENYQFHQGIFIDIFVLDDIKESKLRLTLQHCKVFAINYFIHKKRNADIYRLKYRIPGSIAYFFMNTFVSKDVSFWYDKREKILRNKGKESEFVTPLSFVFETKKRIRNRNIYDEKEWVDFEMIKVPIPKGYDEFLLHRYGNDYMIPKQVCTSHGELIFDADNSQEVYLNNEQQ